MRLASMATATLVVPSIAFADGAEHHRAFLGGFRWVGGDAEREALDSAIEGVVAEMSFLARGIARDRLKEANPIVERLSFGATDKALTAALDSRSYTGPLDGRNVSVKGITGDEMKMCFKIRQGAIDQVFFGEDKGRDNGFRHADDKIVMNVRVHGDQLPKDLVYKLTYGRV